MADIPKIKRNIQKMIDQNAPEVDIDAYIASEGVTPDLLRGAAPPGGDTQSVTPSNFPVDGPPLLPESKEFPLTNLLTNLISNPKFFRPTAELGGMSAGAVIGAPVFPPFGALIGAGLGFAGGRQGANIAEELMGTRQTPPLAEQLPAMGGAFLEGASAEAGGQILGRLIQMLPPAIKHPFRTLSGKTALTQRGAQKEALSRFEQEAAGTSRTQPQIDRNIAVAKQLEEKIPGLKFTQGQLTNDASAISLERTLARKGGQDLSQTQREYANQVLDNYYRIKAAGGGRVTDFTGQVELTASELQTATKSAENAVNSEVTRLGRAMDEQTVGKTVFERLSAGKAAARTKASELYDRIPNAELRSQELADSIDDLIRLENNIIEPRAAAMIRLVRGQIKRSTLPPPSGLLDKFGKPILTEAAEPTFPIGYQNLRQVRSRIGKSIQAAKSGANPNLEDARQLTILKDHVETAMAQVEGVNSEIGELYRKANSFYREVFIPKFRQGAVADVLRPGVRGEKSRIAMANIASEFNSLDGIDEFIAAAGNDQIARQALRDHYAFDLLNKAKDPATGQLVVNKAQQWLGQNLAKLKKLGIDSEFANIAEMQKTVEVKKQALDLFNKSVAGRVLEADTETVVSNAFRGSKNLATTASDLMRLARGNKAAEEGLKKAVAEHLFRQSETTALSFFQQGGETISDITFTKSVAKLSNQIKKFAPALRVIYADQPERLKAIMNIHQAYQTLGRTAKSPVGGGSDTFELFGKTIDIIAGSAAPGKWYVWTTIRNMVNRFGERNVEQYLTKAMFDPDYANTLWAMTKGITPEKTSAVDRLMSLIIAQSQNPKQEPAEGKPVERTRSRGPSVGTLPFIGALP